MESEACKLSLQTITIKKTLIIIYYLQNGHSFLILCQFLACKLALQADAVKVKRILSIIPTFIVLYMTHTYSHLGKSMKTAVNYKKMYAIHMIHMYHGN